MFDLTKEIHLDPLSRRKYIVLRTMLYLIFIIGVFFIFSRIIFPSVPLIFSFANLNSLKNTLVAPRIFPAQNSVFKGTIPANSTLIFDANPIGNFSTADIALVTDKKYDDIENSGIKIRKSYQAFFYLTGSPAGFKNGSLLLSNGAYYIVFGNKLHKFSQPEIITKLGYQKEAFLEVPQDELKYNEIGMEITGSDKYPDGTFFYINENYYQLRDQKLFAFISPQAFLSHFDSKQAVIQNEDFLKNYPLAEEQLEFADGTLASYGESVYILSNGKSYPIADADTFMRMGFIWDDVIPIDSGELSTYKKQKQFTLSQPHPDGTIFFDQATEKLFIIKGNEKHPIESEYIARGYYKQKYINADSAKSEVSAFCNLEKSFLSNQKYSCQINIDSLNNLPGNDYQFETKFTNQLKINNIETVFLTPIKLTNLHYSLSKIKERLKTNYIN